MTNKKNNTSWTKNEFQKACDYKNNGLTYDQIAKKLMRSFSSVEHALRPSSNLFDKFTDSLEYAKEVLPVDKKQNKTRCVGNENEMEAESVTEDIKTLEDLIGACNIDLKKWQIERWTANTWPVGMKSKDGDVITKNLYQVKAQLKRNQLTQEKISDIFNSCISGIKSSITSTKKHNISGGKVFEISIPDLHLGKLAWEEETGHSNYNSGEAIVRFKSALLDFLDKVKNEKISEIILPIGNDFFNVNNKENTTGNGTPQNEDSRWQKSFRRGCKLSTWAINQCNSVAPVKVIIVPGNHDIERTFYLGEFLGAFFKGFKTVSIDNAATARKYHAVGNTLLCFTHGDKIKLNQLTRIAQVEQRELWGKTVYCEWHLGHLHRESSIEEGGVIARVIPSLSPPDAWHSNSGYVTSNRCAQAFLYDKNKGLECIYYHRV